MCFLILPLTAASVAKSRAEKLSSKMQISAPLTTVHMGKREIVVELADAPADGRVELDWFRFT